jgi:hypothetical protein
MMSMFCTVFHLYFKVYYTADRRIYSCSLVVTLLSNSNARTFHAFRSVATRHCQAYLTKALLGLGPEHCSGTAVLYQVSQ